MLCDVLASSRRHVLKAAEVLIGAEVVKIALAHFSGNVAHRPRWRLMMHAVAMKRHLISDETHVI